MKHKASWILAIVLVIAGCVLRFAMPGHDFLGYTLWGIAVLVFLFPRLPRAGRAVLGVLVCAGLIVFAVFEIPVVRDARTDTGAHPNAIIVLGRASTAAHRRCHVQPARRCADYLGANPDALAVVSGGQGEGEDITEARAMADYLTAHGIDSARIVQEDQSRTTRENLENSFAILRARGYAPADGVGIVTSEYHLCRAKRMARALGAEPVGIAAETTLPSMRINYFIREAFAAAYMQLAGTLY
ncbi:MAG: YdcF family protein [Oscillospiraceae bacterium]